MNKQLRIILFVALVDLVGFGLIIPLQATYAKRLGASGLTLGLLVGVYALMQFVFNPVLGRWSDRIGRRPVLLISVGGSAVSHLLLGFADLSHSLVLLFAARMLDGITGANVATIQAYIADVTHDEDRAWGMGLVGAAFGVGFVLGPGIGATLYYVGTLFVGAELASAFPAFGAALISLTALLLVWSKLPESTKRRDDGVPQSTVGRTPFMRGAFAIKHWRTVLARPRLRELIILSAGALFAFVLLEVTFVYLCQDSLGIGIGGTGAVFAYIGLLMVIVQGGLVGRLAKKFGEARLAAVGPFITAGGFVMLATVPGVAEQSIAWWVILAACVPLALGNGLTNPSINSLVSRQAEPNRQGVTLGVAQGAGSLARCLAPPVGGLLYDFGAAQPYIVGGVMLAVAGIFAVTIMPAQQRATTAR